MGGKEKEGRVGGRGGERGEDVEGPGKWSAPVPGPGEGKKRGRERGGQLRPPPKWAGYGPAVKTDVL